MRGLMKMPKKKIEDRTGWTTEDYEIEFLEQKVIQDELKARLKKARDIAKISELKIKNIQSKNEQFQEELKAKKLEDDERKFLNWLYQVMNTKDLHQLVKSIESMVPQKSSNSGHN